ncbi:MAG: hypothetical protein R3F49_23545 [Planctomycetota bacterium]
MLTSLLLALAVAPSASAQPTQVTNASLPIVATFDGRGRVHTSQARLEGGTLTLHGTLTAPSPLPAARRAVVVEVLAADGTVLAERRVDARRTRARIVRRHPVNAEFTATIEGVAGAASVRLQAAR